MTQGDLDLYTPSTKWRSSHSIQTNTPGPRTLEILVTGRKSPGATGYFVDVDEYVVSR